MKEKIQIRLIIDMNDNKYKIYDYMKHDGWNWHSITTYDDLETALSWHNRARIEDITK